MAPPTGFEPAIYTLEECCISGCATEAYWSLRWDSNPRNDGFADHADKTTPAPKHFTDKLPVFRFNKRI